MSAYRKYYLRAAGREAYNKIQELQSKGYEVPDSLVIAAVDAKNFTGNIRSTEKSLNSYYKKLKKLSVSNIEKKAKPSTQTEDEIRASKELKEAAAEKFYSKSDRVIFMRGYGIRALDKISELEEQGFDVPDSLKVEALAAYTYSGTNKPTESEFIRYYKVVNDLSDYNLEQKAKLTVLTKEDKYKVNFSYQQYKDQGEEALEKKLNYYKMLENKLQSKMKEIEDTADDIEADKMVADGVAVPLKKIRRSAEFKKLVDDDSPETGLFDPETYDTKDFRDVMLACGYSEKVVNDLSVALRLGTLEDYQKLKINYSGGYGEEYDKLNKQLKAANAKRRGLEALKFGDD